MNTDNETKPSKRGQEILESLKNAVDAALDKKRKLGQYAIVWDGKKPVRKMD